MKKNTLVTNRKKYKPRTIKWYGGDKGSKLLLNTRIGTLKVWARDRKETDKGCKRYDGVIKTIEYVIVECKDYDGLEMSSFIR